jgi:hypothetical protein
MANAITKRLADICEDDVEYYMSLKGTEHFRGVERDLGQSVAIFQELLRMARQAKQDALVKDLDERFKKIEQAYYR